MALVTCPACGSPVSSAAVACPKCAHSMVDPRPPAPAPGAAGGGRGGEGGQEAVATIIPFRNPLALTSYYMGVFSLIPCVGLLLGPIAFVLGVKGFGAARRHPEMKGKAHAVAGMVLGGLTLAIHIGAIALLVAKK